MATLAEEMPFAVVVDTDKLATTCSFCFSHKSIEAAKEDLKRCPSCNVVSYCSSSSCAKNDSLHEEECKFFQKLGACPDVKTRIISRLLVRWALRKDEFVAYNGRTFSDLMDHYEDITSDPKRVEFLDKLYTNLTLFMGEELVPGKEKVISVYGKAWNSCLYWVNWFAGSYKKAFRISGHNHSCRPTCHLVHYGPKVVMRSMQEDLKYSLNLTISYVAENLPTSIRKKKLLDNWYFECKCEYCEDEERTLLCESGQSACCPDGWVLPRETEALFCSQCGKESGLKLEEITHANRVLTKFVDEKETASLIQKLLPGQLEIYVQLYNKMAKVLSPYNLYLFNLAGFISVASMQFVHTAYSKQFTLARKKAIEKLFPSGFDRVTFLMVIALFSMSQKDENALNDVTEAYHFLKLYYGLDHPQATEFKGYLENVKKQLKLQKSKKTSSQK